MPLYRFEAISALGDVVRGEMEALSQAAVVERLQRDGQVPIRAEEARAASLSRFFLSRRRIGGGRGTAGTLVLVTQQLGMLLRAGLSLDHALEIALDMVERASEGACLRDVLNKIRGGSSLADAMAEQSAMFPSYYIGIVRAGEAGGTLDATFQQLGEFLARSQATREQVKSALLYPIIVVATGCVSIGVLFGFVIPRFRPLIEQSGASLPFLARIVFAMSDGFGSYWWTVPVLAALIAIVLRRQMHKPDVRRWWDSRILKLPLIGDLVVKVQISRFGLTLGTLLRNGVAPLAALTITRDALSNVALRDAVAAVADSVKQGKGLAEPLSQIKIMPRLVTHLTRVGEETGRLDEMLLKIAEIYDQESRRSIDRLVSLLVPAVTIGLGLVVALIVGSMMSAILSVYDQAL
jgi:general secretion pathway protein F